MSGALKPIVQMTLLCCGDFNEIIEDNEKFGAADRHFSHMEDFYSAVYDCGLSDKRFKGDIFMWNNNREGAQFIKERLDRAFGNSHYFE